MNATNPALPGNRLLAMLPTRELHALIKSSRIVQVRLLMGQVLHEQGQPIEHVYLPQDCVISLMTVASDRMTLEVGLIGPEGLAGIAVALGSKVSPVQAVVRRGGGAMRIAADVFRQSLDAHPLLWRAVSYHAHGLMVQATQAAFCSHFHLLETRLARCLLMMRDRVHSNGLHLTHEVLALALGVRRVGITKAATSLQQRGLISYSRGDIRILDSTGLEMAACSCYQAVKRLEQP